jgi:hypothetical protein
METLSTEPTASCGLSTAALFDRIRAWAEVGVPALIDWSHDPMGITLHYRALAGLRDELRRLITLEDDCCVFLTFNLTDQGSELVLAISGPAETVPFIHETWGLAKALSE